MKIVSHGVALAAALGCAALALLPASSAAQTWPQRPVRFLVTLGPGAGVDIGTRLFADRLSTRWGQPVVVENRPGGDGIVAISAFVSAHDDHVLLAAPTSSFTAPNHQKLNIFDLLLQNPRGDAGILQIKQGSTVLLEEGLANYRDSDQHFQVPWSFDKDQPVVVSVNCTQPGPGATQCTSGVLFSGRLVK